MQPPTEDFTNEAIELMRKADAGDAEAQHKFATYLLREPDFSYRKDLTPDEVQRGLRYLQLSATQGYSMGWSADELGMIYFQGEIVPLDYQKAKMWFNTALLKGMPVSAYMLGECAYYGHDEDINYEKAVEYFLQAAFGYVNAIIRLGDMYMKGDFLPYDPAFAKKLYDHVLSDEKWLYKKHNIFSSAYKEVLERLDNFKQSEIDSLSAPINESKKLRKIRKELEEIIKLKKNKHK